MSCSDSTDDIMYDEENVYEYFTGKYSILPTTNLSVTKNIEIVKDQNYYEMIKEKKRIKHEAYREMFLNNVTKSHRRFPVGK